MNKEFKEVTGTIQNIRKDFKACAIDNIWYFGFKVLDFEKGDQVKIKYYINAKGFNNIEDIFEIKEEVKPKLNNEIKPLIKEITNQTFNTILMISKEIYLARKDITIEEATDLAYKSYKRLSEK